MTLSISTVSFPYAVFGTLLHSKHSLGSHEYVQNCRKWENEITLQLLSHSTMRRDLARTVSHSLSN